MKLLPQSASPWLDDLHYDWHPFIKQSELMTIPTNTHLYHQEDKADYIYIVINGRVRLYLLSDDGQEKAITIAGKNCLIGEHRIQSHQLYLKNAVTASKAKLAKINSSTFDAILFTNKLMLQQFIDLQNIKYCLAVKDNLQLSYGSSNKRIREAFYHLASVYGSKEKVGVTIMIEFTHQELANLVGSSRVTVANVISDMNKNGIIIKQGRYYHIPNLDHLLKDY